MFQTTQYQDRQFPRQRPLQLEQSQVQIQGCLYRDTRLSEINTVKNKIKFDENYIQEMEGIFPELEGKERTKRELIGTIAIKKADIDCKKNLIKLIEEIPECI